MRGEEEEEDVPYLRVEKERASEKKTVRDTTMGNMACRYSRRSLILMILASDLFASTVAASDASAQPDISCFRYEMQSNNEFLNFEQDLDFQLRSNLRNYRNLERRRRFAVQSYLTETTSKQDQFSKSGNNQEPQQSQQPAISTKSDASVTVSYTTSEQKPTTTRAMLTVKNSTSSSTTVKPSTSSEVTGLTGSTTKEIIVSTPIIPSPDKNATKISVSNITLVTKVSQSHDEKTEKPVWANQTMWSNVTELKSTEPSETDVDDFTIDKYTAEMMNKTLHENNITKSETDTHQYYNSTFSVDEEIGKRYWVDLNNHPDLQVNTLLSKSHRRAATIKLKFDFPFYGHKVRNITIATGGFLYTGEYVHSWLAATQYIAPLMANFDTTLSSKSFVKYADNGKAFTVEWENVHLQDKPEAGAFTFQVTLLQNGDIIFVYAVIPVLVENIEDKEHPVKIGLSDAYMMDRTVFFARRKTIYEYHRVNFNRQDIKNWTAIYLNALPTCLQADNCNDCLTKINEFSCKWCPVLHKCSTGTFRFRQEWLQKGCDIRFVKEESKCPTRSAIYQEHMDARAEDHRTNDMPEFSRSQQVAGSASNSLEHGQRNMNMGVSGIIGILFVVSIVAGLGAWAAYAYRNPHSASGQMLIRYRPSQWSWRRGEARYTAATIHM